MTSLAVYDTPHPPEGWHGRSVVRIVDPLGKSIAWTDPELAGACIGFCAREHVMGTWSTVLGSKPPRDMEHPGALGCEVIWAESSSSPTPARCMESSWSFLARDPTEVTVAGKIGFEEVQLSSRCDDGMLVLSMTRAHAHLSRIRAGFRLHFHNVGLEGLAVLPGQPNEIIVSSPRFAFKTLACSSSMDLLSCVALVDDVTNTVRLDLMTFSKTVPADNRGILLAELSLAPAAASD